MDRKRRAAWGSAFAKLDRGEEVSTEEHYELLCNGLFDGLNKVDVHEEACFVVRYWLHEADIEPIPWRGPAEADGWFQIGEIWGEERQAEKLRNMIEASAHDPDYWQALNLIAARLHDERRQFPDALAEWASRFHKREIVPPPKRQSNRGEPHYANDMRTSWFASTASCLWYLGLTRKGEIYSAIAAECGVSERIVAEAIKAAERSDGRLPAPWECWPPKVQAIKK